MGVPNNDPFSDDYDERLSQEPMIVGMCELCESLIYGPHMDKILEKLGGRRTLVITLHGSHLYGLNHAESDLDVKGVFIPNHDEVLLGRVPKVIKYSSGNDGMKNGKDDIDVEFYSLHHFFKLLSEGDTGAISMLYAPFEQTCSQHELWETILENKRLFISKDMAGLIGFVRRQTDKYCIKGERLGAANKVLEFLTDHGYVFGNECRLSEFWTLIEDIIESTKHVEAVMVGEQRFFEVCGRKIQDTNHIDYAKGIVESVINSYGKRAKEAEENNGVDWKAVSHAFRVASELTDLYQDGMIHYPLRDAEQIKRIKMGELDFDTEVLPSLNTLMDRVHEMSSNSNFPDKVDKGMIDGLLLSLIKTCGGVQ